MKKLPRGVRKRIREIKALIRRQFVDLAQIELKLKEEINKLTRNYIYGEEKQ